MININSKFKYICNTPPPPNKHIFADIQVCFSRGGGGGGGGGRGVIIAYIFEYFISNAK